MSLSVLSYEARMNLRGISVTICHGDCTVCRQLLYLQIELTSLVTCCTISLTNLEGMYLQFINALQYLILSFNSRMHLLTCGTCLFASQVVSLISFLFRSFLRHLKAGSPTTFFTSLPFSLYFLIINLSASQMLSLSFFNSEIDY